MIDDLLAPFVIGRDARDAALIWQDLYDLQRVRGASGGYYGDALAGIDIALCDLAARCDNVALADWLGGQRARTIPAYVSGLPRETLAQRSHWRKPSSPRVIARSSTRRRWQTKHRRRNVRTARSAARRRRADGRSALANMTPRRHWH